MFTLGITDHLEGPRDQPSASIFAEVADLIRLADRLGVQYAWFSEHHAHAHEGHLPAPLLLALHLAGQTRNICLGTAIICLNLHHPLAIAEQVAVADLLAKGRLAVGFGSGSTPEEFALFGLKETDEPERHARFEEALEIICSAWNGKGAVIEPRYYAIRPHSFLPIPAVDLHRRSWVAVNSLGAAQIAGKLNFNMLFSHLRTPGRRQPPGVRWPGRCHSLCPGRASAPPSLAPLSARRKNPSKHTGASIARGTLRSSH
jgi:alkanesulfonate monooxygenase SsuD/methylene tetrahydromethanopterin reductase-like flavin-dependent oxidoreductase (luciferase family)